MFRRDERSIEYAITHRVGEAGGAERYLRPDGLRSIVQRVQKWIVSPEACQSCQRSPATRLADDMALCAVCHAQRAQRLGQVPFTSPGLIERPTRADEAPAVDRVLQGYAIRFNETSLELGWFEPFFEVIRPSAADRMVAEQPDIRALWNHDSSLAIGRYSAGTLRAEKRSRGVWTEIEPPRWAAGHVESISRRDVTGMSFGFIVLTDEWWLEDGVAHRAVLDMEVMEFSPVSFPAYPTTSIKAVNADDRSARWRERETAERLRLVR